MPTQDQRHVNTNKRSGPTSVVKTTFFCFVFFLIDFFCVFFVFFYVVDHFIANRVVCPVLACYQLESEAKQGCF